MTGFADGITRRLSLTALLVVFAGVLDGCYFVNFFRAEDSSGGGGGSAPSGTVVGQDLGEKAGGKNNAALRAVYDVSTKHDPALIRPDPDVYVRRLLKQYRSSGVTIAQQIGRVERYRLLLGGSSQDFSKPPQETYDATSLLAVAKVAGEVCKGLVAPNSEEHGNWKTILPYGASEERANLLWLAQKFIGRPKNKLASGIVDRLLEIITLEEAAINENWWARNNPYAKYVPACSTLALDAEALYL